MLLQVDLSGARTRGTMTELAHPAPATPEQLLAAHLARQHGISGSTALSGWRAQRAVNALADEMYRPPWKPPGSVR